MILCVAGLVCAQAPLTLGYSGGQFTIRDVATTETLPLHSAPTNGRPSVAFRRNNTFVVWDSRGLTIRTPTGVSSTKLRDVPLSLKAFSPEEIAETKRRHRPLDAAGISGAVRVGNSVFFLVRWEENRRPWAEAILQVVINDPSPRPKLIGRVEAISLSRNSTGDDLFICEGAPTYIARSAAKWGVAKLDPKTLQLTFDVLGEDLVSYLPTALTGPATARVSHVGLFVEKTGYGTTVAGRVDVHTLHRKTLYEGRGDMALVDAQDPPVLVVTRGRQSVLHNCATGGEVDLPVTVAAQRSRRGILGWSPPNNPRKAWLLDPNGWKPLAWWKR